MSPKIVKSLIHINNTSYLLFDVQFTILLRVVYQFKIDINETISHLINLNVCKKF